MNAKDWLNGFIYDFWVSRVIQTVYQGAEGSKHRRNKKIRLQYDLHSCGSVLGRLDEPNTVNKAVGTGVAGWACALKN